METQSQAKAAIRRHFDRMHAQRDQLFSELDGVPDELLWRRPGPEEWSVGENIDHLRVIYRRTIPLILAGWYLLRPLAWLLRSRPYPTEIDNVYRRPGFPQNVGWIWPPHYTPGNPVDLHHLQFGLEEVHSAVDHFYSRQDPDLLGNTVVWDPAIGTLNLIQAVQVGVYHDELHIEQIHRTLAQLRAG